MTTNSPAIVDVQFLERLQIFQVLLRDSFERDIVDVDLVALDQIKQEIERTFENFELDLVIGFHARALDLSEHDGKVNALPECSALASTIRLCDAPRRYSRSRART